MPEPLTADDVAALRAADLVTFTHVSTTSHIRAVFRGNQPATARIWTLFPDQEHGTERSRTILVSDRVQGYQGMGMWTAEPDDHAATCFYSQHAAKFSATWPTTASLLRPGDAVTLLWTAGNNTDRVTDAGLHTDELALRATSPKGTARTFHVAHTITPDNSARMIRRYGDRGAPIATTVPTA